MIEDIRKMIDKVKNFEQFINENQEIDNLIKDITFFKTAQGSKYIRLSDGRIRRWKSSHANTGGEDMGLHDWNQQSIFVDPQYEKEANSIQFLIGQGKKNLALSKTQDGKMVVLIYKDNEWKPATWGDAYPKFTNINPKTKDKVLSWEYKKEPVNGYHVVDFNLNNNRIIKSYHFGSPVSEVKTKGQMDPEDIKLFFPSKSN
jgi:hypothetical protein